MSSFCCTWKKSSKGTKGLGKRLCSAGELGLAIDQGKIGDGFGEPGERTWETHQNLGLYWVMLILFCHCKPARYQLF